MFFSEFEQLDAIQIYIWPQYELNYSDLFPDLICGQISFN
jgi:hypothetical protein